MVDRNNVVYEVNKEIPFTGKIVSYHKNGQLKTEMTIKNGKLDGKYTQWYENGQLQYENTFKDGKQDGKETQWYENGQKKKEVTLTIVIWINCEVNDNITVVFCWK